MYTAFISGFSRLPPMVFGVLPFGLILGAVSLEYGYSFLDMMLSSLLIFAGASQFTLIYLSQQGSPWELAVATAIILNLRMALYSFSISFYWQDISRPKRILMSLLLTDQAYAASVYEQAKSKQTPIYKFWSFLGFSIPFYISWVVITTIGNLIGTTLPENLDLKFTLPLVFLALSIILLKRPSQILSATLAGIMSLLLHDVPNNFGFIIAVIIGLCFGVLYSAKFEKP